MRRDLAAAFARPIAHRGLHRAGGAVENTVAAALAAAERGYGIECDVQLSRDGRAIVFHDGDLRRLAGIDVALSVCDAEALAATRLADGSPIPTLLMLLDAVGGRVPVVVELKGDDHRLADAVLLDVEAYGGVVLLESFSADLVERCAGARRPVGLVGPMRDESMLAATAALPRCDFLSWSVSRIADGSAGRAALPLSAWTVRTPAQQAAAAAAGAQIVFEGFLP